MMLPQAQLRAAAPSLNQLLLPTPPPIMVIKLPTTTLDIAMGIATHPLPIAQMDMDIVTALQATVLISPATVPHSTILGKVIHQATIPGTVIHQTTIPMVTAITEQIVILIKS